MQELQVSRMSKEVVDSSLIHFTCDIDDVDPSVTDDIKNMLPSSYKTVITKMNTTYQKDDDLPLIRTKLLVSAYTVEEALQWLKIFEDKTKTTFNIRSTEKCTGRYVIFKQRRHCIHNTAYSRFCNQSIRRRARNTNCPARMLITLRAIKSRHKYKDPNNVPNAEMPCEIDLILSHNHSVETYDALRFRVVSDEVKSKLTELYKNGHTPSTALQTIKMEMHLKYDNYDEMMSDRRHCPNYNFCYYFYKHVFKKEFDENDFNKESKEFITEKINKYNEDTEANSAQAIFEGNAYIICICPPLVRRVHENIPTASEVVFIDSSSTIDRNGSRVFTLLTHSECGGLPLGVIITSSDDIEVITKGLELLKNMLGASIFYGHPEGPQVFLTDDSSTQRQALETVWPQSSIILCIFHVLQSIWQWLVKGKNNIPLDKQTVLFQEFKEILHAETENECNEKYNIAISNAHTFSNYESYLNYYWSRKELWTKCFRNQIPLRNKHINDYDEAGMRLMKEKIFMFNRVKTFNNVQLVDFITTKFMNYYEVKLVDAAQNRPAENILSKPICLPSGDTLNKILCLPDNIFLVPSDSRDELYYIVNSEVLMCTCFHGNVGRLCKHIDWTCCLIQSEKFVETIKSQNMRSIFYKISTGEDLPKITLNLEADHSYSTRNHLNSDQSSKENNVVQEENCVDQEEIYLDQEEKYVDQEEKYVDQEGNYVQLGENHIKQEDLQDGKVLISEISRNLKTFLQKSADEMLPALKIMNNNLKSMSTVSAVASACSSFGKAFQKKIITSTLVPVQPTAISRRKMNMIGRRKTERRSLRKDIQKTILPEAEYVKENIIIYIE